jgi:hypothetical protein
MTQRKVGNHPHLQSQLPGKGDPKLQPKNKPGEFRQLLGQQTGSPSNKRNPWFSQVLNPGGEFCLTVSSLMVDQHWRTKSITLLPAPCILECYGQVPSWKWGLLRRAYCLGLSYSVNLKTRNNTVMEPEDAILQCLGGRW